MVLSNNEISDYIRSNNMIEFHLDSCIKNCSYKMRIGEIIEPNTGNVLQLNNDGYFIKPSEVVIIQSKEKLHLPDKITASYSALYSISKKGILLINASMIEPGYSGYLSGFLLNFSSQPVLISRNQEIAKVNFFNVNQIPSNITREIIDDTEYRKGLRESAIRYHKSFLNISGLRKMIKDDVLGSVKNFAYSGGIVIFLLILFASLEPLFSRWLWEKTGVASSTEKYKIELMLKDINQAKSDIDKISKDNNKLINLQNEVDSLKRIIKATKK